MTQAEATVVDRPDAGRYEILVDGEVAGFTEYERKGSAVWFTHTEIDPRFEGRGLGSVLARTVLDTAREQGQRVIPLCPFIRGYIKHHSEYLDLVPATQRGPLGLAPA